VILGFECRALQVRIWCSSTWAMPPDLLRFTQKVGSYNFCLGLISDGDPAIYGLPRSWDDRHMPSLFVDMGSCYLLPGLVPNHDPPDLCLLPARITSWVTGPFECNMLCCNVNFCFSSPEHSHHVETGNENRFCMSCSRVLWSVGYFIKKWTTDHFGHYAKTRQLS
jgi:hypothetical protein